MLCEHKSLTGGNLPEQDNEMPGIRNSTHCICMYQSLAGSSEVAAVQSLITEDKTS